MAITREQKAAQLKELTKKFQDAQSIVFAHYIGLTVADVGDLRGQLRKQKAEMKVAKKTLMQLAAKEAGLPEIADEVLTGPVSCIFSFEDPLSGAQVAFKFAKAHNQVELIGGIYDGKILTKEQATELAKMPSRAELLSIFVGMLQAPLRNFMSISSSPLSGFARGVSELAKKGGLSKEPVAVAPSPEKAEAAEPAPIEEAPTSEPTPEAPASDQPAS